MVDVESLASDDVRAYLRSLIHDLLQTYPNVTGFRPDLPEYPCYKLPETFVDFSEPVKWWAEHQGIAFEEIRREVSAFYSYLNGGLKNKDLAKFVEVERRRWAQVRLLRRYPAVFEWIGLKTALSGSVGSLARVNYRSRGARETAFGQRIHAATDAVYRFGYSWDTGHLADRLTQALYNALVNNGGVLGTGNDGKQ